MGAKPFVKWVGGKTQLLPEFRQRYPHNKTKYCEPFVGGGAVLFDVLQNLHPEEVFVNDINSELINTYTQIKENVEELIIALDNLKTVYMNTPIIDRKGFYIDKRTEYNNYISNNVQDHNLDKAALFIFLNKTCFNGLYRVNSKGLFNVPFNNAKNPAICDEENLRECSQLLQNVILHVGDYSSCNDFIDENTFVYLDPPYRPLTESSSFTSYSENGFTDQNQIELGTFITEIANRGATIMASNSDPRNTNAADNFFDDLYAAFDIERIQATRMINSKANGRGAINEILITNTVVNF